MSSTLEFEAEEHASAAGGATQGSRRSAGPGVALLEADAEFREQLSGEDLERARRAVVVPHVTLPFGAWTPPERSAYPAPVTGVVLLEGAVARTVSLGGRACTQIIGPGDIFDPWQRPDDLLPTAAVWAAHEESRLAVLDARFAAAARRWPSLMTAVQRRLCERADRLATQVAIAQLPTVEHRILALMWHLSERFGRSSSNGVVVSLRLTHRLIGELVGAQRSTVSLALAQLAEHRLLERPDDATWRLSWASKSALDRDAA